MLVGALLGLSAKMDIVILLFCFGILVVLPLVYVWKRQARVSAPLDIKKAGVMLIIKDGVILAISRRHNKDIFGLPGGKFDESEGDMDSMDTAIRETREETGVNVKEACFIYERVELGDGPNGVDFYSTAFYALDWDGEPKDSEEGQVRWLTAEELTSTKAAFGDYNRNMLDIFKMQFPDVKLIPYHKNTNNYEIF